MSLSELSTPKHPIRTHLRALKPIPVQLSAASRAARWRLVGPASHPLGQYLLTSTYPTAGPAVDLLLWGPMWMPWMATDVLRANRTGHTVLVHAGAGGGSLLRGLTAPHPDARATTLELREPTPAALDRAAGMLAAPPATGDLTVHADGTVSTTGWRTVPLPTADPTFPDQEILITGGLGGLGVRVALALATVGARPVLVDALRPDQAAADVIRCLQTLRRVQPAVRVLHADLTDPGATAARLTRYAPRALVHCAGRIGGGTDRTQTADEINDLVAAKVTTLRNVMGAVDSDRMRAVLAFGSVTAHGAHPGLSGYALANELLRREVHRLAAVHQQARWCTAEWSLWSGAGMARRVAREAAPQLGMVPVPVATGVRAAVRMLAVLAAPDLPPPPQALLVAGVRPGAEGRWAGRPEGLPGIDAELRVPPGADVARAMRAVVRAAAAGAHLVPQPDAPVPATGAPLLVRATVHGDLVDCVAVPGACPDSPPLAQHRHRIATPDTITEEG